MNEQLKKFVTRINAMTLRERIISFVMAAVVLLYIVNALVVNPLFVQQKKLAQQIKQNQSKITEVRGQIEQKIKANMVDPDAPERLRLQNLMSQREAAQASLQQMQTGLIAPERMAGLLDDILKRNGGLRLVSLRTLPVSSLNEPIGKEKPPATPIAPDAKEASTAASTVTAMGTPTTVPPAAVQAATNPGSVFASKDKADIASVESRIYKHGVEITVQGSYLDMLKYMTDLEAMPWQLFWSRAKLNVDEYPKATLTLTVFTLSLDKKWLNL